MKSAEEHHFDNHGSWPFEECHRCKCQMVKCGGKITYPDAVAARQAARDVNSQRGWGQPVKGYNCRYCDGYHLATVKSNRDRRKSEKERRKVLRGRVLQPIPAHDESPAQSED